MTGKYYPTESAASGQPGAPDRAGAEGLALNAIPEKSTKSRVRENRLFERFKSIFRGSYPTTQLLPTENRVRIPLSPGGVVSVFPNRSERSESFSWVRVFRLVVIMISFLFFPVLLVSALLVFGWKFGWFEWRVK